MVELCFNQSAQGALKMAQHCGGKGRHSVGIAFCTSEDGEKPSTRNGWIVGYTVLGLYFHAGFSFERPLL